ncbi:hypothetical protein SAMN02745148_01359 [Modicisalibacter ilicicola DSM 19980]|uniref:Uncharacterized protein n=1 Tax=Modicisalibacter ilicicola DSM 19980 TaxID=1121942 RepID=A0A1M4X7J2_9GAMM|nr:hypothetical protein [Halomonas ilicicola]SHE89480.1 hypothetical protein SAMN02745148_01359 [Halomonas ilicicola DSM 19980]
MSRGISWNLRQKLKLLAFIALFSGPLVAAWAMVEWRVGIPEEKAAHGRLEPTLPPLSQWPLEEGAATLDHEEWVLAYDCLLPCGGLADRLWRLHRALGREAPRVTRLRLGGGQDPLPGEQVVHWQERPAWSDDAVTWLIDFEGRVVLSYGQDDDPSEILEDVRRLLRMNPEIERLSRE